MSHRQPANLTVLTCCAALVGCLGKIHESPEPDGGAGTGTDGFVSSIGDSRPADSSVGGTPDASLAPNVAEPDAQTEHPCDVGPNIVELDAQTEDTCDSSSTPDTTNRTLVTLAAGQSAPYNLAVDSTSVYFTTFGDGSETNGAVAKVPIDGGVVTTLATSQGWANGIAVDSSSVYWTAVGGLLKMPLIGGTPTLLSSNFTNDNIALGPFGVCGTNGGDAPVTVPLDGGATLTLGPTTGQNTYGVACDSLNMYWTNFDNPGPVSKVPLDGGAVITLATGPAPMGLAIDATSVYWVNSGGQGTGSLVKVPLSGGAPQTLASGLDGATGLAIDSCYAYVTLGSSPSQGAVVKVPLTGGCVTTLLADLDQPSGIAVDDTSVYFTTVAGEQASAGTIMKLTPK